QKRRCRWRLGATLPCRGTFERSTARDRLRRGLLRQRKYSDFQQTAIRMVPEEDRMDRGKGPPHIALPGKRQAVRSQASSAKISGSRCPLSEQKPVQRSPPA